jgi:hypothetical protein
MSFVHTYDVCTLCYAVFVHGNINDYLEAQCGLSVSGGDRCFSGDFPRIGTASLQHAKCREWLSSMANGISGCGVGSRLASTHDTGSAIGDTTDESASITSELLILYKTLVLPEVSRLLPPLDLLS